MSHTIRVLMEPYVDRERERFYAIMPQEDTTDLISDLISGNRHDPFQSAREPGYMSTEPSESTREVVRKFYDIDGISWLEISSNYAYVRIAGDASWYEIEPAIIGLIADSIRWAKDAVQAIYVIGGITYKEFPKELYDSMLNTNPR